MSNYFDDLLLIGHIAVPVLRALMRPIVTDRVAWSVGRSVCWSVYCCVTLVSPAKMAVAIEMPFGLRTRMDQMNHLLDGDPDYLWEGVILRGKGRPIVK